MVHHIENMDQQMQGIDIFHALKFQILPYNLTSFLAVCLVLSIFWGIFLGVKYAKCEDPGEKENLHKVLVNFCIGAIAVLVLIAVVYAIREPLARFIDSDA